MKKYKKRKEINKDGWLGFYGISTLVCQIHFIYIYIERERERERDSPTPVGLSSLAKK